VTAKVEALEVSLAEKDFMHNSKVNSLTDEYETAICAMTEKLD